MIDDLKKISDLKAENKIQEKEPLSLTTPMDKLEEQLLNETNIDELNKVINLFNLNIKRKDMVRTSHLNDLQDKITNQISERLDTNAGEFSNKDLIEYFKVIQATISNADNSLEDIDTPAIQINQQINIGQQSDELSRSSREKVKNVIDQILNGANLDELNKSIIDVEDIEEVNDIGDDKSDI